MPDSLDIFCTYDQHKSKRIVRICFSRGCCNKKSKRKVCELCWLEMHQDHLYECIQINDLVQILRRYVKVLNHVALQSCIYQQNKNIAITLVNEAVEQQLHLIQGCLENLINDSYQNFDEIIDTIIKVYYGICEEEIYYAIYQQFFSDEEFQIATSLKQEFQQIFGQVDQKAANFRLQQIGNDLFSAQYYHQAKLVFDILLQEEIKVEYLEKKYISLLFQNKDKEITEFLNWCQLQGISPNSFINTDSAFAYFFLYYELFPLQLNMRGGQESCLVRVACMLFFQKKYDDSLTILEEYLSVYPDHEYAIELKVQNLIAKKQLDEAFSYSEKGLQLFPNNIGFMRANCQLVLFTNTGSKALKKIDSSKLDLFSQGKFLIQEKKYNEALEILSKIRPEESNYQTAKFLIYSVSEAPVKLDDSLIEDLFLKFWAKFAELLKMNKYNEAIQILDQKFKYFTKSKMYIMFKTEILLKQQQFDSALQIIELAVSEYPDEIIFRYFQSFFLFVTNQNDKALNVIEYVLNSNQYNEEALKLKGKILFQFDKLEESSQCFKQLSGLLPNDWNTLFHQGIVLMMLGQWENAVTVFEQILQLVPNHELSLYNKGISLSRLGQYEKALEIFNLNPNFERSFLYYIAQLVELCDYDKALEYLNNVQFNYPYFNECLLLKGQILFRQGLFEQACQIFGNVHLTIFSDIQKCSYAFALSELQQKDQAIYIINQAEINPMPKFIPVIQQIKYYLMANQNGEVELNLRFASFSILIMNLINFVAATGTFQQITIEIVKYFPRVKIDFDTFQVLQWM